MFKSSDAGKTWSHIGLDDTRQIGRVVVDPKDANRVYVAALGNIYAPNPDRGVYRSTDGGATGRRSCSTPPAPTMWAQTSPSTQKNPRTIYVFTLGTRRPPWSVHAPANLPGGGLFKSTDGGDTWKKLTGGLPTDEFVGRIGIAIAPSDPKRILWAVVDDLGSASPPPRPRPRRRGQHCTDPNPAAKPTGGIYVSNDAGATWRQISVEARLGSRGWYFNSVAIDPVNPDRAYIINTAKIEMT